MNCWQAWGRFVFVTWSDDWFVRITADKPTLFEWNTSAHKMIRPKRFSTVECRKLPSHKTCLKSKYANCTITRHTFSPFSNWVQNRESEKQCNQLSIFFLFWLWKQSVISFLDLVLVWFWEWMSPNRNYCSMLCMLHPCWHSHNLVTYHKRAAETAGILMLRAMKTFISRLWVSPPFWSYSWYGVYILIWETRVFLSLHKW